MNKKKEIFREGPLNRENGYVYTRFRRLRQAHFAFDLSLWNNRQDIRTLLGRSHVYQKYLQYNKALEDVEEALKLKSKDFTLLKERALILYLQCNFTYSLIYNYRGYRKQPSRFETGILENEESINSCIGDRVGQPLRDHYYIIRKLVEKERKKRVELETNRWKRKIDPKQLKKWIEKISRQVLKTITHRKNIKTYGPKSTNDEIAAFLKKLDIQEKRKSRTSKASILSKSTVNQFVTELKLNVPKSNEIKPLQEKTTNLKNLKAEKYLRRLRYDKNFLQYCTQMENINNPNTNDCQTIIKEATRGYNMCVITEEAMRAKNPMYALRYQEIMATKSITEKNLKELEKIQEMRKKNADMFLLLLRSARENKQLRLCLKVAEQAKIFFDRQNRKSLPQKTEYVDVMYNIVGLAYLDTFHLNPKKSEDENKNRVKFMLGIPLKKIPSRDSLIEQVKPDFINYKKKISICETRIRDATSALELAWLFHELSKYLIETKRYEIGRHYAYACIHQANILGNEVWEINGSFLIVKAYIGAENRNEAHDMLLNTLELSRQIYYPNSNALIEFMQECLLVLEELDFGIRLGDVVKERETNILNVCPPGPEKTSLEQLFRQISSLPPMRRFTIMPGGKSKSEGKVSKLQRSKSVGKKKNRDLLQLPATQTVEALSEMLYS